MKGVISETIGGIKLKLGEKRPYLLPSCFDKVRSLVAEVVSPV